MDNEKTIKNEELDDLFQDDELGLELGEIDNFILPDVELKSVINSEEIVNEVNKIYEFINIQNFLMQRAEMSLNEIRYNKRQDEKIKKNEEITNNSKNSVKVFANQVEFIIKQLSIISNVKDINRINEDYIDINLLTELYTNMPAVQKKKFISFIEKNKYYIDLTNLWVVPIKEFKKVLGSLLEEINKKNSELQTNRMIINRVENLNLKFKNLTPLPKKEISTVYYIEQIQRNEVTKNFEIKGKRVYMGKDAVDSPDTLEIVKNGTDINVDVFKLNNTLFSLLNSDINDPELFQGDTEKQQKVSERLIESNGVFFTPLILTKGNYVITYSWDVIQSLQNLIIEKFNLNITENSEYLIGEGYNLKPKVEVSKHFFKKIKPKYYTEEELLSKLNPLIYKYIELNNTKLTKTKIELRGLLDKTDSPEFSNKYQEIIEQLVFSIIQKYDYKDSKKVYKIAELDLILDLIAILNNLTTINNSKPHEDSFMDMKVSNIETTKNLLVELNENHINILDYIKDKEKEVLNKSKLLNVSLEMYYQRNGSKKVKSYEKEINKTKNKIIFRTGESSLLGELIYNLDKNLQIRGEQMKINNFYIEDIELDKLGFITKEDKEFYSNLSKSLTLYLQETCKYNKVKLNIHPQQVVYLIIKNIIEGGYIKPNYYVKAGLFTQYKPLQNNIESNILSSLIESYVMNDYKGTEVDFRKFIEDGIKLKEKKNISRYEETLDFICKYIPLSANEQLAEELMKVIEGKVSITEDYITQFENKFNLGNETIMEEVSLIIKEDEAPYFSNCIYGQITGYVINPLIKYQQLIVKIFNERFNKNIERKTRSGKTEEEVINSLIEYELNSMAKTDKLITINLDDKKIPCITYFIETTVDLLTTNKLDKGIILNKINNLFDRIINYKPETVPSQIRDKIAKNEGLEKLEELETVINNYHYNFRMMHLLDSIVPYTNTTELFEKIVEQTAYLNEINQKENYSRDLNKTRNVEYLEKANSKLYETYIKTGDEKYLEHIDLEYVNIEALKKENIEKGTRGLLNKNEIVDRFEDILELRGLYREEILKTTRDSDAIDSEDLYSELLYMYESEMLTGNDRTRIKEFIDEIPKRVQEQLKEDPTWYYKIQKRIKEKLKVSE